VTEVPDGGLSAIPPSACVQQPPPGACSGPCRSPIPANESSDSEAFGLAAAVRIVEDAIDEDAVRGRGARRPNAA
jgi:hypothetical protein